jgi:hypothetical protein
LIGALTPKFQLGVIIAKEDTYREEAMAYTISKASLTAVYHRSVKHPQLYLTSSVESMKKK